MASGDQDREERASAPRTWDYSDAGAHRCLANDDLAGQNQAGQPRRFQRERPRTAVAERRATRLVTRPHSEPQPQERTFSNAARKDSERHVNFQTSSAPAKLNPVMDPLRERGGFRLLTDAQLK